MLQGKYSYENRLITFSVVMGFISMTDRAADLPSGVEMQYLSGSTGVKTAVLYQ